MFYIQQVKPLRGIYAIQTFTR